MADVQDIHLGVPIGRNLARDRGFRPGSQAGWLSAAPRCSGGQLGSGADG